MTTETTSQSKKPIFRLGFCPRAGQDRNGQPTVGYPIEIGAVFARREEDKGLIAKFHIVPVDLKDGALLLMPVRDAADEQIEDQGAAL